MRALSIPALILAAVLPARAVPPPSEVSAEPAATDEAAPAEAEGADAEGIQEDLDEGRRELEELLNAEDQVIGDDTPGTGDLHRLGPANPLRQRAMDALDRLEGLPSPLAPAPEGDAGAVLAELAGLDLATLKATYDIPVELNEPVLDYIRFFQGRGRTWFAKWLARSERWIPFMRPILAEEGVPLDLVYLSMIESGFSPYAYSWARASGFWQFISATGRRYGLRDDFWVDERRDPVLATRAAARYLKDLHEEFGDWYLAWAAYNAGEGKIRRAIRMYGTRDFWELTRAGRYLRKETKHYVPKLIAAAIIAKHPERFGFTGIEGEGPFEFEEVVVADATDFEVVAKAAGTPPEILQQMNMALRRWCTPPARAGKGYLIKVPRGTAEQFAVEYAKVAPSERLTFRHHKVKRGDTIGAIASAYGMPADAIMKMNGVKNARALRLGMDLIIPLPTQIAAKYPDKGSAWKEPKVRRGRATVARTVAKRVERTVERPSGGGRYVIKSGDTLWSIAQKFGVGVDELKKWNSLGRRGHKALQVGQALHVAPPKKAASGKGRG